MRYTTECYKCGGGTGQAHPCICGVTPSEEATPLSAEYRDLCIELLGYRNATHGSKLARLSAMAINDLSAELAQLRRQVAEGQALLPVKDAALYPFAVGANKYNESYGDSVELWQNRQRIDFITVGFLRAAKAALNIESPSDALTSALAAERERCAKLCREIASGGDNNVGSDSAYECEAAILALCNTDGDSNV